MAILNFKEILELIDKVADKNLGAVEIESSGVRIRVEGRASEPMIAAYVHDHASSGPAPIPVSATPSSQLPSARPASLASAPPVEEIDTEAGLHIITSPIVGTYYRAPNPESSPFVNVGDRISKGQVLCIVEAMKLMNEIESDVEGVIAKIYPSNGQPIEYGEKLFAVRLS